MKTTIFIPQKINVGFQERRDTYTGKLAYIIYFDQKNVLRKETSWNSWRDEKIENQIYENVPTSGFVLNKKAGGYDTGWNHRQTYCRVYDPRGFEFEITIPNLLYILENTTSTKGKGLEGEFVYGWDGKDLVLMPTESPDYKEISNFSKQIQANNFIKAKDLIIGATYKTKTNIEWIYMGRFNYYTNKDERVDVKYDWVSKNINKGKYHFFVREFKYDWEKDIRLETLQLKSLGEKFIETISTDCVENYSELFNKLECTKEYSPIDENKSEYIEYSLEEFLNIFKNRSWFRCYNAQKEKIEFDETYNKSGLYKYFKYNRDNYFPHNENEIKGTLEEIYNKLKPMYKNQYLNNGKLYYSEKVV